MLTDHVFIITGASSGIGAATAIEAARRGMDVVLSARRPDRLDEVAVRVRDAGRRAATVAGSVTDPGMSDRLLDTAQSAFGRFDFVFANAGYGLGKTVLDTSEAELRELFEVNFFAGVDLLTGRVRQTHRCPSAFDRQRQVDDDLRGAGEERARRLVANDNRRHIFGGQIGSRERDPSAFNDASWNDLGDGGH